MKKRYESELRLECGNGNLRIVANLLTYNWMAGNSESGDSPAWEMWWEGQGRLVVESEELVFNFETRKYRDIAREKMPSLEEAFMTIWDISENATIPDKDPVLRYFFLELRGAIREKNEKEEDVSNVLVTTQPTA